MRSYPFYPPLIKVVRPRFSGFMLGRVASMPQLQLSNWDPARTMTDVLRDVVKMVETGSSVDVASETNNKAAYPEGAYSQLE